MFPMANSRRPLFLLLALIAAFTLCLPQAHAQKKKKKKGGNTEEDGGTAPSGANSKQMAKQWKAKAKLYMKNPLALKAKEDAYQRQIEEITKKNAECEKSKNEAEASLERLESSVRRRESSLDSLGRLVANYKSEIERTRAAYEAQKNATQRDVTPGVIFRLQIGAFQKFDINKYLSETGESFSGENADQLNKYMMGKFRDYKMAENFRDDVRRMGLRDAWIVAYRDGVRIDIKEAKAAQGQGSSDNNGPAPKRRAPEEAPAE
jgi:hypothetical protein